MSKKEGAKEEELCCICQEHLEDNDAYIFRCSHSVHAKCAFWFRGTNSMSLKCPLCRKEVEPKLKKMNTRYRYTHFLFVVMRTLCHTYLFDKFAYAVVHEFEFSATSGFGYYIWWAVFIMINIFEFVRLYFHRKKEQPNQNNVNAGEGLRIMQRNRAHRRR